MFKDIQFVHQKSTNLQSERFGIQETCTELCRTVDAQITVSFPTFYIEKYGVKILQIEQKLQDSWQFNG